MSQHDYSLANQSGAAFRSDLNDALAAIVSQNSGATEPTTTFAHMPWVDTSGGTPVLKIRNAANSAWVIIANIVTNFGFLTLSGGTMTGALAAAAGTVGAPSITFDGDLDTGVYSPAANTIAIVVNGAEALRADANGITINGTGSVKVPAGTTAQRPGTPTAGMFRFNSTTNGFEGYNGSAWGAVGGGATGAAGNAAFYENDQNVTADYTITSGKNAMSAGEITINSGVTVTVPTGSTWTIV